MANTIQILLENGKRKKTLTEKIQSITFGLVGGTIIAWVTILLFYEVPCILGKNFNIKGQLVKNAIRAEQTVTMKYRTKSYSINKILHELEEMKEFYSYL